MFLFILLIALFLPSQVSGSWSGFRGDNSNSAYSARSLPEEYLPSWKKNLNGGWLDPTPAVEQGRVYVFTNGEYDFENRIQVSPSMLFCLDEVSGMEIWSREVCDSKVQLSSPAVGDGIVAVGSSNGILYAFDALNGATIFTFETLPSIYGITSSPLIVDQRLIFCSGDGVIYCMDLMGTLLWSRPSGGNIYFSSPASLDNLLYVGNDNGTLLCLSLETGVPEWSHQVEGRIRTSPVALEECILFTWSTYSGNLVVDGWLRSLNPNGSFAWEEHIGGTICSPSTDGNNIYVGTNKGEFLCLTLNGERVWTYQANGPIQSSPVSVNNGVVFISNIDMEPSHSTLYFLDKEGVEHYHYEIVPHQWVLSSPVVGQNSLIFACDNGWVYCLSPNSPMNQVSYCKPQPWYVIPGQWHIITLMALVTILCLTRSSIRPGTHNGRKISPTQSHLKVRRARLYRNRLFRYVFLGVVVLAMSGLTLYLFWALDSGNETPDDPVKNITLELDFGPEEAPINTGYRTSWTWVDAEWVEQKEEWPNDVWVFDNLSSGKNSVLSVLETALGWVDAEVRTTEYVYGVFVVSIGGVEGSREENDWLYWVNGNFANLASDRWYLEDGDVVLWKYTNMLNE